MKVILLNILLVPVFIFGQDTPKMEYIDSIILVIENDPTIIKKLYDTVSYQKEDGGNNWDSAYHHREWYYINGQIVKIRAWNSYGNWRNDMLVYYVRGKPIKFSKGESFYGEVDYGKFEFEIYYYLDKEIKVNWLIPKTDNVIGVAADIFLQWAYSLLRKANKI